MASPRTGSPRIGILVVAFNAASTLAQVLDRTAPDFRGRVTKILIGDDARGVSDRAWGSGRGRRPSVHRITILHRSSSSLENIIRERTPDQRSATDPMSTATPPAPRTTSQ